MNLISCRGEDIQKKGIYLKNKHPVLWTALFHHKTHKNSTITFKKHQYLIDIYTDESSKKVIMKSTQSGISEYLIIYAMNESDLGRSVFYVLPTDKIKNRFVQNRFNKSVGYTPYYQSLVNKNIDQKQAESLSLKHIGSGAIAFVGSNTPNAFVEYPADVLVIDELDRCDSGNLPMAIERLSASNVRHIVEVSNPTIQNFGIDIEYQNSDRKKWLLKCESCGQWVEFDFFKHVVREEDGGVYVIADKDYEDGSGKDINIICDQCEAVFDRYGKGEWVSTYVHDVSGYQISKLFSTNMTIAEMVQRFGEGLVNDSKLQRFYNGDLGLPYTSQGASIGESILDECIVDYFMPEFSPNIHVAGIDVGVIMHIVIAEVMQDGKLKLDCIKEVREYEEVIDLFKLYNVRCFVIDGLPETRLSKKLCLNTKMGFMNFYTQSKNEISVDSQKPVINSNRTMILDSLKEQILTRSIFFPKNARDIHNFYPHMKSSVRLYDDKKDTYNWVHGNEPDHYFHAMGYLVLARRLLLSVK